MRHRIRIRHPSELATLAAWRLTPLKVPGRVHLEAEGTSPEKVRLWEQQLTRLQSPCGCEQGAFGLLVGVAVYLVFLLTRSGGWGHPGWRGFWVGFGVVLVTTSVGKLIGVLAARRKLRRVLQEIQSEWKPQRPLERGFGQVGDVNAGPPSRCCGGV